MKAMERLFVDSKLVVHVLVCVFAISSWVDINGLWVELPILVTNLPEQWTLPSYIIAISQVANLGPIIFFVLANCVGRTRTYKTTLDKVTSYAIMLVGVTSTLLLAFLWRESAYVAGADRSVALLALSFFLAFMDCTSSLAYVAFMAALKPSYMASFFLGEGLSGLLPALLALGQGAGDIVCVNGSSSSQEVVNGTVVNGTVVNGTTVNVTDYFVFPKYVEPRFSVQVFFLLMSGIIALSIASFTLINFWSYCKDQFVQISFYSLSGDHSTDKSAKQSPSDHIEGVGFQRSSSRNTQSDFGGANNSGFIDDEGKSESGWKNGVSGDVAVRQDVSVVVINFLITSFLLSVQVYSSLPYGISIYNLVVTLSNIANPAACAICIFVTVTSTPVITLMASLGVACGAYIIVAASMSPAPPLVDTSAGGPVAVVIWVGASFFLTFAKISVASVMRKVGRRALIWYGAATQSGALLGALTGFVLVNEIKVFKDAPWC
ncbi:hypothetical protein BaRGS_00038061 [Batillaria attramentaria]|uniref:Riboflavin transporter n=1 Tax=Batillaria attramentaria TaxID=370345 RepID=A0ABD0J759_9CAEN